jgi:hypothetical protein
MACPRFVTMIQAVVLPDIFATGAASHRNFPERNVIGNLCLPDINYLS